MSNINDPKAEKFIAILNLSDTLQYFLDAHEEINGCIDPCECDGCKAARFHLERIGRSDAPKNNEEQSEDAALPDGRWIYAPVTDEDAEFHAQNFAAHQIPDGDVDFDRRDYETFIRALKYISESTNLFRAPPTN